MSVKHSFRPGQEVEGFRIVRALGRGGYGAIYMATVTATGQAVALKVECADQRRRALQAERAIFALLQGCRYAPALVRYTATARHLFLAMECLGPSLRAVREAARGGRLSLSTTLRRVRSYFVVLSEK